MRAKSSNQGVDLGHGEILKKYRTNEMIDNINYHWCDFTKEEFMEYLSDLNAVPDRTKDLTCIFVFTQFLRNVSGQIIDVRKDIDSLGGQISLIGTRNSSDMKTIGRVKRISFR